MCVITIFFVFSPPSKTPPMNRCQPYCQKHPLTGVFLIQLLTCFFLLNCSPVAAQVAIAFSKPGGFYPETFTLSFVT